MQEVYTEVPQNQTKHRHKEADITGHVNRLVMRTGRIQKMKVTNRCDKI